MVDHRLADRRGGQRHDDGVLVGVVVDGAGRKGRQVDDRVDRADGDELDPLTGEHLRDVLHVLLVVDHDFELCLGGVEVGHLAQFGQDRGRGVVLVLGLERVQLEADDARMKSRPTTRIPPRRTGPKKPDLGLRIRGDAFRVGGVAVPADRPPRMVTERIPISNLVATRLTEMTPTIPGRDHVQRTSGPDRRLAWPTVTGAPTDEPRALPSPCVVVLIGPVASGKSTWAKQWFEPAQIISSDALRALVGESEHDLAASTDAFALLDDVVTRRLQRQLTTVIDTLGLDADQRRRWRDRAAAAGMPCVAVVFDTPARECRRRNSAREIAVRPDVVANQLRRWPDIRSDVASEPWHDIVTPDPVALVPAALVPARPAKRGATTGTTGTGSRLRQRRRRRPTGSGSGCSCRASSGRVVRRTSPTTCGGSSPKPRPPGWSTCG